MNARTRKQHRDAAFAPPLRDSLSLNQSSHLDLEFGPIPVGKNLLVGVVHGRCWGFCHRSGVCDAGCGFGHRFGVQEVFILIEGNGWNCGEATSGGM